MKQLLLLLVCFLFAYYSFASTPFLPLADSLPPTLICPANLTITLSPGRCDTFFQYSVTADDNEPGVLLSQLSGTPPTGAVLKVGKTTNLFQATDAAGNSVTCVFNVRIVHPEVPLVCKDTLRVHADSICAFTFGYLDCLAGSGYGCPQNFKLELDTLAPFGNGPWLASALSALRVGKVLGYRVSDLPAATKCQGLVELRDTTAPRIVCQDLMVSSLIYDLQPNTFRDWGIQDAYPSSFDNCNPTPTLTFSDSLVESPCPAPVAQVIWRYWKSTDAQGNTAACNQLITAVRSTLSEVQVSDTDTIECQYYGYSFYGTPFAYFAGVRYWLYPPAFSVQNADSLLLSDCGGEGILQRIWTIQEMCSGAVRRDTQLVFRTDRKGPTMNCAANAMVRPILVNGCTGTLYLPEVLVTGNCSVPTAIVAYWENAQGLQDSLVGTLLEDTNPFGYRRRAVLTPAVQFPLGQTMLTYRATDPCGNVGSCMSRINVLDSIPPLAACDTLIKIYLEKDGKASCFAKRFNTGSYDNCTPDKFLQFKGKRLEANACHPTEKFQSWINFCCSDVGDTIPITLRAYDVVVGTDSILSSAFVGQFGDCTARVLVLDSLPPQCVNPPEVHLNCDYVSTYLAMLDPYAYTSCQTDSILVEIDSSQINSCGAGKILRKVSTYSADGTRTNTCQQTIKVGNFFRLCVKFPDDVISKNQCLNSTANFGEPKIYTPNCGNIEITYSDSLTQSSYACAGRVRRRWRIKNLCVNGNQSTVPNPEPTNNPLSLTNRLGPTVAYAAAPPAWKASSTNLIPNGPVHEYRWDFSTSGYLYDQYIYLTETSPPIVLSSGGGPYLGDHSNNDSLFWYHPLFQAPLTHGQNLPESPVDLSVVVKDSCGSNKLLINCQLNLDLNGNGNRETNVKATSFDFGTVKFNNNNTIGTWVEFDRRNVPMDEKYRFAVKRDTFGDLHLARLVWATPGFPLNYAPVQLPHGQHEIIWEINNGCSAVKTQKTLFTVGPQGPPSLRCDTALTRFVDAQKTVVLTTAALTPIVLRGASIPSGIQYGLLKSSKGEVAAKFPVYSPVVTYDCTELGQHFVQVWARDSAGRSAVCLLPVLIKDSLPECVVTAYYRVGGQVRTDQGEGVDAVQIAQQSVVPNATVTTLTDGSGSYQFNQALSNAFPYTLSPSKLDNPLNGISTYDLILISKHILGLAPIVSPYRIIAADANRSGSVTTFDIVELRKLILGIYQVLPLVPSWRFVPQSWVFPRPENPFATAFPEKIAQHSLLSDRSDEDFIGIKVGDLDGSAIPNVQGKAEDRDGTASPIEVEDYVFQAGEKFTAQFRLNKPLQGYQFTLETPGLEITDLEPGLGMSPEHFSLWPGALATAFENAQGQPVNFKVSFQAREAGLLSRTLFLSDRLVRSEAYPLGTTVKPGGLRLQFNGTTGLAAPESAFKVFQNQPNPWREETLLPFYLPEGDQVALYVFDALGRILWQGSDYFPRGFGFFSLQKNALNALGLLYYRIETQQYSGLRSMLLLR